MTKSKQECILGQRKFADIRVNPGGEFDPGLDERIGLKKIYFNFCFQIFLKLCSGYNLRHENVFFLGFLNAFEGQSGPYNEHCFLLPIRMNG